jgi:hypothetical protein
MSKVSDRIGGISANEYRSIHRWLKVRYGVADHCDNIACQDKSLTFYWAKKRGKPYARDVDNFLQLCFGCHEQYDREEKDELVRFQVWVTPAQTATIRKLAENRQITDSQVIRELIDTM